EQASWTTERVHIGAAKTLSKWTKKYNSITGSDNLGAPYLILGGITVAAFGALGLVAALPVKGRSVLVNFWGFFLPAMATVGDADTAKERRDKAPSKTHGYWVLFGLFAFLDGILPAITPCYFFAKACVLTWAASSTRPFGGRARLDRAFEIANTPIDHDRLENNLGKTMQKVAEALEAAEKSAAEVGIPRRAVRLAAGTVGVSLGTFALGISFYLVLAAEGLFAGLPAWTQARVCIAVGAPWPLYATLVARARSAAAVVAASAEESGDSDGIKRRRLGPAAVQWLSYWPIFALFLAVLDPIMGWLPHFYSFKIVALAFLALPHTRGAYMITSLVLDDDDRGSDDSPREGGREQKISCDAPSKVPIE
ncbi:unnamed protein product, partial [Scytosiphon promiscuus]